MTFQSRLHGIAVHRFSLITMAESTEETKKVVERHCRNERKRRPPAKRQVAAQATYLMMCFQTQFNAPKFLLAPD
jgi:hypothetical protein